MKIIRNLTVPFKMYGPIHYMAAQKPAIRRARKEGDFTAESAALCKATTQWGDALIRRFHMNVTIRGEENIPSEGPVVIVCNHQGYADIPIIMHTMRNLPLSFVAKKMMRNLPFYGNWMRHWECCAFIDQNNKRSSIESLQRGMELLKKGYSMVVFPEGHRSRGAAPRKFQRGSFRLATELGVPILPVSLNGSYRVFEQQGYIRPASIQVTIHPMEQTAGLDRMERVAMIQRVEETIGSVLGRADMEV